MQSSGPLEQVSFPEIAYAGLIQLHFHPCLSLELYGPRRWQEASKSRYHQLSHTWFWVSSALSRLYSLHRPCSTTSGRIVLVLLQSGRASRLARVFVCQETRGYVSARSHCTLRHLTQSSGCSRVRKWGSNQWLYEGIRHRVRRRSFLRSLRTIVFRSRPSTCILRVCASIQAIEIKDALHILTQREWECLTYAIFSQFLDDVV